ncbi:hypothetical protein FRACYDRAFT_243221 [Fragilariopsis cylindrus CCMP1102]|uniref:Uncharacterized protein n=1 Tax=Fragilariopsis cylindrus CCMP1102 TaxID=635003 RepID=A0A1E7F4L6_9STRA|nr:hypothetical protein FRACYDRAFT_243221 [Fragilariopsis cylindrus CCMP1102]|eukprot:OEU12955.1 hypothetical protein FRACYDRAFT_243221 [Fragilariopsis cylindrus CCMP1102]
MAKPVGLTESTFYRQKEVVETKDTFIKSIERLPSEHRSTQTAMAKALGLNRTTFIRKAKKYGIITTDTETKVVETKDTFIKSIERLPSEHRSTQTAMAKALGLNRTTFIRKAKKYGIITTDTETKVVETKDTFIESIERLSSEHRSTQQAMAKALRLPFPTFRSKAHRYGIKWRDYFVEDKLLQEEKKRKRAEETEETETKLFRRWFLTSPTIPNEEHKVLRREVKERTKVEEAADRKALASAATKIRDDKIAVRKIRDDKFAVASAARKIRDEKMALASTATKIRDDKIAVALATRKIRDDKIAVALAARKIRDDNKIAVALAAKKIRDDNKLAVALAAKKIRDDNKLAGKDEEAIEKVRALVKKILQKKHKQPGGPYNKNKKARKAKATTTTITTKRRIYTSVATSTSLLLGENDEGMVVDVINSNSNSNELQIMDDESMTMPSLTLAAEATALLGGLVTARSMLSQRQKKLDEEKTTLDEQQKRLETETTKLQKEKSQNKNLLLSTIGSVAVGTILSAGGIVEGLATTTVRSLEGFSGRKGLEGLMKSTMKGGGFKRTTGTNSEITAQPYTMENIPELPYLETQIEKVAETNRRAAMNPRQQQRYTNSLRNKRDKLTIRQGEIEELRFKRESSIAQEENRLKAISDEEERLRFEVATKKAESEAKKQAEAEANKQAEKEAAAVKAKAEVQAKKRAEEEARAASKNEEERLRLEQVTQKEKERLAELRAAIPKQQRYATVTGGGESLPIFDIEKLRTLLQQLNISPGVVGGLAAATLIVGGSVTAVKRSLNDAKEREDNIQEENAQKDKDDFNNNNNKDPSSSQSTTSTELWSQPKVTALIGRKSADSISQESVKIDETTNKPKQSFSPFGRTENSGNPTSPLSQSKQSFSPFERDPSSSLSTKTESSIKPKQSFSPFQSSIKPPSTMRSSTSYDAPPNTSNKQEGKVATTDSKQAASPVGAGFGAPPKVGASRVASPFGAGAAPKQGAEFPKFTAPGKQANSPLGDGFGGSVKTDATPKQSFSPFGVIPKTSSQTLPSGSLGTNNPTSPSSQTASNSSFGTPTSPLSTKDESSIKPKQSFSPFERVAKPSSLTNVGSFPPSVRAPLSTSDALSKKEQEQQERRTENSRLAEVNRRVSAQSPYTIYQIKLISTT